MENKFVVPNLIKKITNDFIDGSKRRLFIPSSLHAGKTTFTSYFDKRIIVRKEKQYASVVISPSDFVDMDNASNAQLVEYIELLIGEKLCNIWKEYENNNDLFLTKAYEPFSKSIRGYKRLIFSNLCQNNNKVFVNNLIIGDHSTRIMETLNDIYDISRYILVIDDFDKLSPKVQSIIYGFYKDFDRVLLLVDKKVLEVYRSECKKETLPIISIDDGDNTDDENYTIDYNKYNDVLIMILSRNMNFNLMPYKNNQLLQYIISICAGDIKLMEQMIKPILNSINNIRRVEKYKEYLLFQRECYIQLLEPEERKIHIMKIKKINK